MRRLRTYLRQKIDKLAATTTWSSDLVHIADYYFCRHPTITIDILAVTPLCSVVCTIRYGIHIVSLGKRYVLYSVSRFCMYRVVPYMYCNVSFVSRVKVVLYGTSKPHYRYTFFNFSKRNNIYFCNPMMMDKSHDNILDW